MQYACNNKLKRVFTTCTKQRLGILMTLYLALAALGPVAIMFAQKILRILMKNLRIGLNIFGD